MCRLRLVILVLALLPGPLWAAAQTLQYDIQGLNGELRQNVRAWLGPEPESVSDRSRFLSLAREQAQQGLQALGYYNAEVSFELTRSEPTWQLSILVQPNEPVRIRNIDVRLNGDAMQDEVFLALLSSSPFAAGETLHHGEYERFKAALLSTGQQRGFFDGRITESRIEVNPAAGSADIWIHYDSGRRYRFGELEFDEEILSAEQVEALLDFQRGDEFDLSQLQQFQGALQRTGYFSSVIIRPRLDEAVEGEVPLSLELFPAKRHNFNLGIGYRTDTEERVSLTWRTPRINSAGHSQETRFEYSPINPSGRTTYNIPLSHPTNDVLQLSARAENNEFGDLDSRQNEVGIRRERRRDSRVRGLSVRALNESWELESLDRENNYLLAGISFSDRRRRGSLVDPAHGFSQLYQLEGSAEALGSDIDLLRAYARFGYVNTFSPGHRLAARAELGTALVSDKDRDQLAPSLNFFAGGSRSIRGFGYNSIGNEFELQEPDGTVQKLVVGGDRLLTGSVEYQYDFRESWRGALFADFGDAFDDGEFDTNYSVGFGVHYLTLVGAVKLQLALPVSDDDPSWRFHLDIGAEF